MSARFHRACKVESRVRSWRRNASTALFYLDLPLCVSHAVMDWIVSPQNSYVEAKTPSVTVLGDEAFKEVIKIN